MTCLHNINPGNTIKVWKILEYSCACNHSHCQSLFPFMFYQGLLTMSKRKISITFMNEGIYFIRQTANNPVNFIHVHDIDLKSFLFNHLCICAWFAILCFAQHSLFACFGSLKSTAWITQFLKQHWLIIFVFLFFLAAYIDLATHKRLLRLYQST